jgi:pimeloyl-ACP methyl ester carboxylesterase
VLVHGLWGSGDKTDQRHYSWKDFEPQFSSKQLYDITIIDYHDSNADRFIRNAKFIKLGISDALQANKKQKFATVRLDLIGNSMGGLLPREYCGNNPDECKKRIRKFVTTDSPHLGSELARLINIINQQPETSCSLLLPIMQASGKRIWEGAQSRKLKGALIDLSIGSDALQSLAIPPRVPSWSAITGVAIPGATPLTFFAHDISLNLMWVGLLHFCNKVPEGIYANLMNTVKDIFPGGSFLSDVEAIFSEENDRIVSMQSQSAFALQQVKILGVDHITVLGNSETIKKVQELLEKP